MDDKVRNDIDEDEETPDAAQASGPLGRLLEHRVASDTAQAERAMQTANEPGEPSTGSTDYAEGTREHDDDGEGEVPRPKPR